MSLQFIEPKEVAQKIVKKENVFILDVRGESNFKDWKITGEKVEIVNIPSSKFVNEDPAQYLKQIPRDKEVVVICNKGNSSKVVGQKLIEAGYKDVYSFEGGMQGWSEHLFQTKVYEDEQIKVYQFIRVGKGCLSYMVISGEEALIVDPARFIDVYEQTATAEGVKIAYIVDSHLHADHISGGRELAERNGAKYYIMKSEGATFHFEPLEEHEHIQFEKVNLDVLAVKTPGHTPGSVSFLVNNKLLFSGDTIFVGGLGRPDLGGKVREWAKDLYETVYGKVSQLADDIIVLPAHYSNLEDEMKAQDYVGDTLGNIRKHNQIMQNTQEEEFINKVAASVSAEKPPNFEDIIAINRGTKAVGLEIQQEMEIGPNRCAVHHTS